MRILITLLLSVMVRAVVAQTSAPPPLEWSTAVLHAPANTNTFTPTQQLPGGKLLGVSGTVVCIGNHENDTLFTITPVSADTAAFVLNGIKKTADGGYIAYGTINGADGDFTGLPYHYGTYVSYSPTLNTTDGVLIKYDSLFNTEWIQCFGGTHNEVINDVSEDKVNGGFIFTGNVQSDDGDLSGIKRYGNATNYWIGKTDTAGTLLWTKAYGGNIPASNPFGSSYKAATVIQLMDGNYLVGGETAIQDGDIDSARGNTDIWVLKLNSLGNIIWKRNYGGSNHDNLTGSMMQLSDSAIVIYGNSQSNDIDISTPVPGGKPNLWILKIAPDNGGIIWEKSLGTSVGTSVRPNQSSVPLQQYCKMSVMPDGNLIFGAFAYGATDLPNYHTGTSNAWSHEIYILKLSKDNGSLIWHKQFGGSRNESGLQSIKGESDGSISVRALSNSIDGDLDPLITTGINSTVIRNWYFKLAACPAFGYEPDVTICKGDSYTWAGNTITTAGSYYDTLVNVISCDSIVKLVVHVDSVITPVITASGNTLSTGTYSSYQWLDGSSNPITGATAQTYEAATAGNYSVVVTGANGCTDTSAAYSHTPIMISEPELFSDMKIYPTPASDVVHIELPRLKGKAIVTVNTSDGRTLITQSLSAIHSQLSLEDLPGGFYFIKITTEEGAAVRKIMRE